MRCLSEAAVPQKRGGDQEGRALSDRRVCEIITADRKPHYAGLTLLGHGAEPRPWALRTDSKAVRSFGDTRSFPKFLDCFCGRRRRPRRHVLKSSCVVVRCTLGLLPPLGCLTALARSQLKKWRLWRSEALIS